MRKKILLFALLFFIPANAQELNNSQLDSLYEAFIKSKNIPQEEIDHPGDHPENIKCGFGLVSQIRNNFERYSLEKQQILKSLLQRPARETSLVSPAGKFRIHYNLTGNEKPNYDPSLTVQQNAQEVAKAFDSSYNFEVTYLGYPPPPPDNGEGGDDLYDVYITYAMGNYGFTQPEIFLGDQKYTSHIQIHYDLANFYTKGFEAMRVTAAHEFHHAIQIGNYTGDKTDIDGFFYELTSTAMEEFVYDNVNDYYGYMPGYFNNPDEALANNNGYNLAIWNIFLHDKFGYDIIKRQWEMLPSSRALAAIQNSLIEVNSSFKDAFNEFGIWTFFTGNRAIPGEYFEEAENYPLIRYTSKIPYNSTSSHVQINVKPSSNNFIAFVNSSLSPDDSLVVIITNGDYANGIENPSGNFPLDYTLTGDSLSGGVKLTEKYYAKIDVNSPLLWSVSEILNYHVLRQNGIITPPVESDDIFVYPNPFYYNQNYNSVFIVMNEGGVTEYDFNVYTSGMELVYSDILPVNNKTIRWDIKNEVKDKLATGVYIFALRSGNKTSKGKLVIFNE